MGLFDAFSRDIGIDLGTANTLVFLKGKGVVVQEPSVVAMDMDTGKVLAVGLDAKQMLGRTPANVKAVRPLRDGVIADFDVTEEMLRYFMRRVHNSMGLVKPKVVVGCPSGVTEVERRAIIEAVMRAGAREAHLIEEPKAAAIGAGLPVTEATGSMIVDIGGGTTEVAVISLGGIVSSISSRTAGDELDDAIVQHMKKVYNLLIGERTSEEVKQKIGSAYPVGPETYLEVRGRDLVTGLPKTVKIDSTEIRDALAEPIGTIVNAVKECLEKTPPELSADVMDRGIILAGGGALLQGLDKLLSRETGISVFVCEDPLTAVARGTGIVLDHLEYLKGLSASSKRYQQG